MIFSRQWAMPNKWTFLIEPIAYLIGRYVGDGKGWIDPFAGENSSAEITNDLNPARPTDFHMEADEFLKNLPGHYKGILFDPPYSPRQIKEVYEEIGLSNSFENTQASFWSNPKNIASSKVDMAICFGWNSNGFGLKRGFEMIEILIVPHGGAHNDTIVTVERKIQYELY